MLATIIISIFILSIGILFWFIHEIRLQNNKHKKMQKELDEINK